MFVRSVYLAVFMRSSLAFYAAANRACMSCEIEKFKLQAEKNARYSSRRAEALNGITIFFSLSWSISRMCLYFIILIIFIDVKNGKIRSRSLLVPILSFQSFAHRFVYAYIASYAFISNSPSQGLSRVWRVTRPICVTRFGWRADLMLQIRIRSRASFHWDIYSVRETKLSRVHWN